MAREAQNEIQKVEQPGTSSKPEQTRTGTVHSPTVDIFESEGAITVLADMPGLKAADLNIDLRDNVLTLTGRPANVANDNESWVFREFESAVFFRQFTLVETIDQSKIDATLSDGVLRLELPKVEKARPRQVAVRSE
jgi:HSP20 family protein